MYYRTDAKADWVLLRSYNEYKPNWQLDTILLPAVTATYQLAFEGNDNLGRGIVLDNIEVRSMPSCEQPYDIEALKIANNNVTIEWNGSFDTQEFHIKVSTAPLSATDLADEEHRADVLDTYVSGELVDYEIGNLTSATRYYCYIRAICAGEKSSWSQEYSFETSNLVELPDTTNFNLPLTPGYCSRYEGWYYGNTTGDACPYVNTNSGISELKQYSFDGTTTLFFATEKTNASGIGAPDRGRTICLCRNPGD